MTAALAAVTTSGLEDGVPRSHGEGAGEVVVERGPGAAYHMFVVMEDLVEKLKLLRFEEEFLRKSNLKVPSRHYFALNFSPCSCHLQRGPHCHPGLTSIHILISWSLLFVLYLDLCFF
uniref:Intraflagellar transport protein 57 homolog n=1 Tax=Aotus nancymaae TaxID=37293 RepID=A0A2K5CUG9_AOTNA